MMACCLLGAKQGGGEYYSGTRLAQNDKHDYTKNIVLEYYSSTDLYWNVQYLPQPWCQAITRTSTDLLSI